MKTNLLGKTELSVSKIGFGCAPLGNEYGNLDNTEAIRSVHAAIDHGINLFDTSPYYGRTLSETRLGEALKGKRDKVILATKGGRFDVAAETGFDFSYDSIINMCEASLKRLQTDVIDVYQLHDVEFGRKEVVINEAIPALFDLKKAGKVRFIGVTGYPVDLLHEIITTHELDVTLSYCHFNLQNQTLHQQLLPAARERNMGVINASITGMGLLTPQGPQSWHPASDHIKAACKVAADYCAEHGVSIAQLAIQYALQNDQTDATLLGTRTTAELESSIGLLHRPIDEEILRAVQTILEPALNQTWPSGFY
ncbi:MAG: aldo/keto reductase [Chloroflexota bacterium]